MFRTQKISITLPKALLQRLNKQQNRSKTVAEALELYFSFTVKEKFYKLDIRNQLSIIQQTSKEYKKRTLKSEEIVEAKNETRM